MVSIIDPLIDDETRTFKIIGLIDNKKLKIKARIDGKSKI